MNLEYDSRFARIAATCISGIAQHMQVPDAFKEVKLNPKYLGSKELDSDMVAAAVLIILAEATSAEGVAEVIKTLNALHGTAYGPTRSTNTNNVTLN